MTFSTAAYHDDVVRRAQAEAADTVQCPHCPTLVARSRLQDHINVYHKDVVLAQCEEIIGNGIHIFMQVWGAFQIISEQRLYEPEYATFAEYCQRRWNMSRQRGYQLINFVKVMADVSTVVDADLLPANEAQARELVPYTTDERRWILQTVKAASQVMEIPVTARLTKAVGELCATGLLTGTIETQEGSQIALNAAATAQLTAQVYEAMQRQKTHIQANSKRQRVLSIVAQVYDLSDFEDAPMLVLRLPKGTDVTALRAVCESRGFVFASLYVNGDAS